MPADLDPALFPDAAMPVWDAWCDLADSRQGGFGIGPLTYSEIDAYMRTTGARLQAWEVDTLKKIDRVYRRVFSG